MNKAVKYRYGDFGKIMFGQALLVLIDRELEFYKKYKSFFDEKDEFPDPVPLVKYIIRKHFLFGHGDHKKTLEELKRPTDPYETISFQQFGGRFAYDYDEKGFLPMYAEVEGTQAMKRIWDCIEAKRVFRAWSQARKFLWDPRGDEPILIYDRG